METLCKTPAQAAKRIRLELKANFPGIKFSVLTRTYSMGNTIDITWTDGPESKAVNAIVKKYEYGRFDGMTDSSSVEDTLISLPGGEVAYLGGAKHVFTQRLPSLAAISVSAEETITAPPAALPEVSAEVATAAQEIVRHLGRCALTMRAEARRTSVYHRAYVRYPTLDRGQVLIEVLRLLLAEVMT